MKNSLFFSFRSKEKRFLFNVSILRRVFLPTIISLILPELAVATCEDRRLTNALRRYLLEIKVNYEEENDAFVRFVVTRDHVVELLEVFLLRIVKRDDDDLQLHDANVRSSRKEKKKQKLNWISMSH